MALTNFLITAFGVGAIAYMMKTDVRHGSSMLRRNLKHIRSWMETQGDAAEKVVEKEIKQVTENTRKTRAKKP
ncbi:hypothetical protein Ndes2526B_g03126 [Nannochloris sp. 'desiccata']